MIGADLPRLGRDDEENTLEHRAEIDDCGEPDFTSVEEVVALTEAARLAVVASGRTGAVADAYAVCAADQVALGDIVQAYYLAERAAEIHEAYTPLRARLYAAEWPPERDVPNDDPSIVAVQTWAATGQHTPAHGGVA